MTSDEARQKVKHVSSPEVGVSRTHRLGSVFEHQHKVKGARETKWIKTLINEE